MILEVVTTNLCVSAGCRLALLACLNQVARFLSDDEGAFGTALRQATDFVESLRLLIGLYRVVPDFRTLSHRQKTLRVNISLRGSQSLLDLLIDSSGING